MLPDASCICFWVHKYKSYGVHVGPSAKKKPITKLYKCVIKYSNRC
jgi:hypothetical protein